MSSQWPDKLSKPNPDTVACQLAGFWTSLGELPGLILRGEHLLVAEQISLLRNQVVSLMLALNGIARPPGTRDLNAYLSTSQRKALEKTLIAPTIGRETWIGQAVALVVIYRWYAPQLVDSLDIPYPDSAEQAALSRLADALPDWPRTITTE